MASRGSLSGGNSPNPLSAQVRPLPTGPPSGGRPSVSSQANKMLQTPQQQNRTATTTVMTSKVSGSPLPSPRPPMPSPVLAPSAASSVSPAPSPIPGGMTPPAGSAAVLPPRPTSATAMRLTPRSERRPSPSPTSSLAGAPQPRPRGRSDIDARTSRPTQSSSGGGGAQQASAVANYPNWGPPPYPPPSGSSSSPIVFAAPTHSSHNIADDEEFFAAYKVTWEEPHPIHDGIERPAVLALLPPPAFWLGKHCLDVGCGTGRLCRQFRSAHALSVTGIDSSERMLRVAEAKEQAAAGATSSSEGRTQREGSISVSQAFRRFFRKGSTEEQREAKLTAKKAKAEEEARANQEKVKALALATWEAERELERTRQANGGGNGGAPRSRSPSSKGTSASSGGLLSKLFKKEKRELKPSSEAEFYRAEAESKRAQREHEEAVRTAAAATAAAAASAPTSASEGEDASSSGEDELDPIPFLPVTYIHTAFEHWDTTNLTHRFDLITCCMTLQFTWDLYAFARKVYSLLNVNGLFVMSVDHPAATAAWGTHPIAIKDPSAPDGILYFPLDHYSQQGERQAKYYMDGVTKFHRKMESYINAFLAAGLVLEKMVEPVASEAFELKWPQLKKWRRMPIFLCMRFRKPRSYDF